MAKCPTALCIHITGLLLYLGNRRSLSQKGIKSRGKCLSALLCEHLCRLDGIFALSSKQSQLTLHSNTVLPRLTIGSRPPNHKFWEAVLGHQMHDSMQYNASISTMQSCSKVTHYDSFRKRTSMHLEKKSNSDCRKAVFSSWSIETEHLSTQSLTTQ